MGEMSCPKGHAELTERRVGEVTVHQCPECRGVFIDRVELGDLIEAEIDWHRDTGPHTQPMPRITADMTMPPPPASAPRSRSYIESLFN
jgi:Zn-finger nucleic acid-binding protein